MRLLGLVCFFVCSLVCLYGHSYALPCLFVFVVGGGGRAVGMIITVMVVLRLIAVLAAQSGA